MSGFRYAFSLPAGVVQEATPLGTVQPYDQDDRSEGDGAGRTDHLRLVPAPSRDQADPLNWPQWRKLITLVCVAMFSFTGNIASASLTSALPFLATDFDPPVTQSKLVHLIAVSALMLGVANVIFVPLANIFGRRPIVLLSLAMITGCSVWAASASSYDSLLAARVLQGAGGAATDTLCPTVIGETFFRHQRGRAMAVYTIFLTASSFLGGIIGGYISESAGWRWTQWLNAIIAGTSLVTCAIFQAETLFNRDAALLIDSGVQSVEYNDSNMLESDKPGISHEEEITRAHEYKKFTFVRSLKIGVYRGDVLAKFVAPWLTLRFPGVWLVMLQYGCLVGAIVIVATIGPQFVSLPPYNWGGSAGLINVGALIGTMVGVLATYTVSDWALKRYAHRQKHGLSEPESRLPGMLPGFFLATTGLWIFGFVGDHPSKNGWIGLEFGYGMLGIGLIMIPSIGLTYIIEAYSAVSSDAFVMVGTVRALIGFAWTFFVGEWIQERGASEPFGIFGMLMGVFGLLIIPVWLYGKRLRIATQKWLPNPETGY